MLLAVCLGIVIADEPRPAQAQQAQTQAEGELHVVGKHLLQADLIFDRLLGAGILLGLSDCTGLPLLLKGLEAEDPIVVRAAGDTLLASGANTLFPEINKRALENETIGEAILWSLTENFHPEFKPLIDAALREGKGARRHAAILALAKSGNVAYLPELLELAGRTDPDGHAQAYALYAIAALGAGARVRDQITATSRSGQAAEREIAAVSLGHLNEAASRPALERLSNDPAPQVRIAALASAARMGDERAAEQLEAVIRSDDLRLATLASAALERLSADQTVAIMQRSLACCELAPSVVMKLLESWGSVSKEGAPSAEIEPLGLDHADPGVRLQATWALGRRAEGGTESLLSPFLNDPDPALRGMAAWALVQIGRNQPASSGAVQDGGRNPVCTLDAAGAVSRKRAGERAVHAG